MPSADSPRSELHCYGLLPEGPYPNHGLLQSRSYQESSIPGSIPVQTLAIH